MRAGQEISASRPVATSNTKPRTLSFTGTKGLARIRWTDGSTSTVTCEFVRGKLVKWELFRPQVEQQQGETAAP